jgi:hypothetical protein
MLINLMKYEFLKRWKSSRFILLGYLLIQTLLLTISSAFFWNDNMAKVFTNPSNNCQGIGVWAGIAMASYLLLSILVIIFPFTESIFRFNRDLSGKQSALEMMIPAISWKKVISKLIPALCNTLLCIVLGAASIITFMLISSKFEKSVVDGIMNFFKIVFQSPTQFVLDAVYLLFCFTTMYLIVFFSIALSKSFSHKNKIAAPIGIVTFVAIIAALAFLGTLLQSVPLVQFTLLGTEDSLSSIMLSVLVFLAALFGTSWLMESKIDH